ncbi:bZIP transcription factor 60-like [Melia azedarach]|uniref:BZIP transcription factor 60-like n=1 Tax=Melia azedarach TaxID=155640 RepID=A0ACC1WVC6_MELAZ|nr:bZIP transcription factor 60-like [Melia azedarach]
MEDKEFLVDDIDWENLVTELMDPSSVEFFPSPDGSASSRIGEIESILMNDSFDDLEPNCPSFDDFFTDILVDTPSPPFGVEIVDLPTDDKDSNGSDESGSAGVEDEKVIDGPEANNSDSNDNNENDNYEGGNENADDPISKKRRRQLRNRDAAVRSRERKKMYVKDLEMKSRYLEGECRKLGRLLQCVLAENQALRFSLQPGNAHGASLAKQESAVLLLESLLLGSLLWFLGNMCLFTLPKPIQSKLESVLLVQVEEKAPGNLAQRGAGGKIMTFSVVKSRRCKASKRKMKIHSHVLRVLVGKYSFTAGGCFHLLVFSFQYMRGW